MDVFSEIKYESPLLYLKTKNQAEEIFGYAPSFIKNMWILQEYQNAGGAIIAPEKLDNKQYTFIKNEMEVSLSSLGKLLIIKELRYSESFLDNAELKSLAENCVEKIENLLDGGLTKKSFQELYSSIFSSDS